MAGKHLNRRRRVVALAAGLVLAASGVVTATTVGQASAESAASGDRPVTVTFDNQSSQFISACVFGSGGRCTNGGIAAGATAAVADPFNSKKKVRIAVLEAGTPNPAQVERTVTAKDELCATVTDGRDGSLKLRVEAGSC